MTLQFEIKLPTEIPPKTDSHLQISDRYFAKVLSISGSINKTTIIYDFKNKKWLSIHPGLKEVIEYYTELCPF